MSNKRNGSILKVKFFTFLLPTVMSIMAMSLNEFVDSLIVSNLINSDAMSLITMASPLVTAYGVVYTLLGIGGSALYAVYSGRHDIKRADSVFSVTFITASLISVIILLGGIIFLNPMTASMCKAPEYYPEFIPYVKGLIFSAIVIIPVQVIIYFMPAFGCPGKGTIINIAANVINLLMDYVYIGICGMGLEGAAYATLTGYAAGFIIVLFFHFTKEIRLPLAKINSKEFKILLEICSTGLPSAMNQIGYCIKIAFVNSLAFGLAGMAGVTTFSVCMQAVSMVSILIGGVIDATIPMSASLYGQRDFAGIRILMKTAMTVQFTANLIALVFFEAFPKLVLDMYNVGGDMTEPAIIGLRIFSLSFITRGFILMYMCLFPVNGRKGYAFIISLFDGFLGIIPLSLILTRFHGINGLWEAFALLPALMLAVILVVNLVISARSGGKYSRFMLIEKEDTTVPVFDCTIMMSREDISELAGNIESFCESQDLEPRLTTLTALVSEEMSVYTLENSHDTKVQSIDIILKIFPDYVLMDFRSIGKAYDLSSMPENKNDFSSMTVLRKIASSFEYNYTLGMNQTRIKVDRR